MLNSLAVHNNHVPQHCAQDAELLKESGVHKLVVADRDGNCLAFVLAWDSFDYDAETDTYVCVADSDGRELMTVYTAGEIKSAPGANMYVVTAPDCSVQGVAGPVDLPETRQAPTSSVPHVSSLVGTLPAV